MPVFFAYVPWMTCRHCVRLVTTRLRDLPGVVSVEANAETGELVVQGEVSEADIRSAIADAATSDGDRGEHPDDART